MRNKTEMDRNNSWCCYYEYTTDTVKPNVHVTKFSFYWPSSYLPSSPLSISNSTQQCKHTRELRN